MPKLSEETYGSGDQTWLGSTHGIENARTGTIADQSKFTPATHFPKGYVPSGLPVNCASEKNLLPWTGAEGEALGFVLFDRALPKDSKAKIQVPVLRHGLVRKSKLPVQLATGTGSTAGFTFVGGN